MHRARCTSCCLYPTRHELRITSKPLPVLRLSDGRNTTRPGPVSASRVGGHDLRLDDPTRDVPVAGPGDAGPPDAPCCEDGGRAGSVRFHAGRTPAPADEQLRLECADRHAAFPFLMEARDRVMEARDRVGSTPRRRRCPGTRPRGGQPLRPGGLSAGLCGDAVGGLPRLSDRFGIRDGRTATAVDGGTARAARGPVHGPGQADRNRLRPGARGARPRGFSPPRAAAAA